MQERRWNARPSSAESNKAFGKGRFFEDGGEKLPALHRYSLLIVVLLFFAYLISASAVKEVSFFDFSGNIIYRGQHGVALVCPIRWDARAVEDVMQAAEDKGASITFFVRPEWAAENETAVARMREKHAVGLLGNAKTESEFKSECERFRALQLPLAYYMPEEDGDANEAARWAGGEGISVLLCSFDVLSRTSSSRDAVERMLGSAFEGAIIRFEPTGIMQRALPEALDGLAEKGFQLQTISDLRGEHSV